MRSRPHQSLVVDRFGVFTISKPFAVAVALVLAAFIAFLVAGCETSRPQKGGQASNSIVRHGHTNLATLSQPENPKEPSRQTVQSEQTLEYVLPAGTTISLGDQGSKRPAVAYRPGKLSLGSATPTPQPAPSGSEGAGIDLLSAAPTTVAVLGTPMPVRMSANDRTETTIGAAQKDTAREWAAKAASVQPVMWAGIAMMTVVAGLLAYFGWWTKAGVAVAIGVGMIVLAQTLPTHGTLILFGGLVVFALVALLVLYSYHKGQLDQNNNGIPDFLEPPAPKSQP